MARPVRVAAVARAATAKGLSLAHLQHTHVPLVLVELVVPRVQAALLEAAARRGSSSSGNFIRRASRKVESCPYTLAHAVERWAQPLRQRSLGRVRGLCINQRQRRGASRFAERQL